MHIYLALINKEASLYRSNTSLFAGPKRRSRPLFNTGWYLDRKTDNKEPERFLTPFQINWAGNACKVFVQNWFDKENRLKKINSASIFYYTESIDNCVCFVQKMSRWYKKKYERTIWMSHTKAHKQSCVFVLHWFLFCSRIKKYSIGSKFAKY